ncbi:uncharacterized protein LOC131161682 [Malania oleifera]|uniref:uncharacterized protein LOC131161682 n=1 Tax=Malania oleifera TaxID=397392 RepID=UPI0025AE6A2E|nr:uncharacterized protein LOC131161682 [Malania oleifera]
MENYSFSSYPDSHDSSPRSREMDCENPSWDELPSNFKVKFMCSYGGKIHPRPHDNQLAYVGGDTKILAVDRSIRLSDFISKLSSLYGADVCFKYQLPGEDLDALISVTNDEDLEHMMLEYDRMYRASAKPARLRLFLFHLNPPAPTSFGSGDPKSERQWFVDALNSVQMQSLETSSPPAAAATGNPDFLFGLDKGLAPDPATKLQDPAPAPAVVVPDVFPKGIPVGLDPVHEDRHVIGDPVVSSAEIQRQIQELQRLQISHEQALLQRKCDENNPRAYPGEYYPQKVPEKHAPPAPAPSAVPVSVAPGAYWRERHMTTGGYPVSGATGADQPVYIIPTPGGVYQTPAIRTVTSQVGQAYYGVQRVVPEIYREQPVYNAAPPHQQAKVGAYAEAIGTVRPSGVADAGYAQVTYDGSGRQVYYTAPGAVMPPYQAVAPVDGRQTGAVGHPEGKIVAKAPQASSM